MVDKWQVENKGWSNCVKENIWSALYFAVTASKIIVIYSAYFLFKGKYVLGNGKWEEM